MSRRKAMLIGLVALAALLVPVAAGARIDPLHVLTGGGVRSPRAEVILVVDTSSKMILPSGTGAACSGVQPNIDYCGDGVCSGVETATGPLAACGAAPSAPCKCLADCVEGNDADLVPPNYITNCGNKVADGPGRLYALKRAMRNVIPEFRTVATFSLDTFPRHHGYYPYVKAKLPPAGAPMEAVSIFLTELELKYARWIKEGAACVDDGTGACLTLADGTIVKQTAWDWVNDRPALEVTVNSVPYKRLDQAAAAAWPVQFSGLLPIRPIRGADSVYRREEDGRFYDKRFAWQGHQFSDGTYTWKYVGSYFTFMMPELTAYFDRIEKYLTAAVPGNVRFHDLLAGRSFKGPIYVDAAGTWVHHKYGYDAPLLQENPTPTGIGFVWPDLYLEPSPDQAAHDAKLGMMMQWLNAPSAGGASTNSTSNAAPAWDALKKAKEHFFDRIKGTGPYVCPATGKCADGTACAAGAACPDKVADCRQRFVIFLTDGKHQGADPWAQIKALWDESKALTGVPIPTYTVGMFVESKPDQAAVDTSADMGNDGELDSDTVALTGGNEAELTIALRTTLLNALKGDYTTAAPGVTTISTGTGGQVVVDNVSLLPSTEYPGWKGHVRAVDLAESPPKLLWDAGLQLQGRGWTDRAIFGGAAAVWGGKPVRLIAADGSGAVNLNGTSDPSGVGIKQLWPKTISCGAAGFVCPMGTLCGGTGGTEGAWCVPSDSDLVGLVQWIAGKNRPEKWKLGPVIGSVPATVGPPPEYNGVSYNTATGLKDHVTYENTQKDRPRVTYVLSNEGGMHAFYTGVNETDANGGYELFFFVIPDALWRVFDVYRQGGQDVDPKKFKHVLTSSVRVEDMPDPTKVDGFVTQVVLSMGAGGSALLTLDVTDPVDKSSLTLRDPPFVITQEARSLTVAGTPYSWPPLAATTHGNPFLAGPMGRFLGETWSIPSVFYYYGSGTLTAHYAFGSGYFPYGADTAAPHNDEFYLYHDATTQPRPPVKAMHLKMVPGPPPFGTTALSCTRDPTDPERCHTGVVANAVGVVDDLAQRKVIAVYQADLSGRLVRFPEGLPEIVAPAPGTTDVKELLGSDASYVGPLGNYPLHFPPAAFYEQTVKKVVLALNTHAYTENQWDFDPTTPLLEPPAISRLGMLVDDDGVVGPSKYCAINDICDAAACNLVAAGDPCPLVCQPNPDGTCPAGCVSDGAGGCKALAAPSARALPTSQPLLLQNISAGDRMEAFFLYYDPPPVDLNSCGDRVGDTWAVRMVLENLTTVPKWSLAEAKKVPETYGSGLTIVGRGKDLGLALTGIGEGAQAQVATYSGGAVGAGLGGGVVVTEGVREVN